MTSRNRLYSWYVVALLGCLYFMSWVDRLVLSLLVEPLKADLGIDDLQVSYLFGASFAVFYSAFGILLARVADRRNRKVLISVGVFVWCGMTIASGFVESFLMLLLFRVGLAFGEAALSPAALSIISDLFPKERRSLPLSLYSVFGQLGGTYGLSAAGLIIGLLHAHPPTMLPFLAHMKSWQLGLVAVGLPGLLLGLIVLLTLREPPRSETGDALSAPADDVALLPYLRANWIVYTTFLLGLAVPGIVLFSITGWMPTLLIRDFGWTAPQAGLALGTALAISGVAGILAVPHLAGRWAQRGRATAVPDIAIVCVAVECLALALALQMRDPYLLLLILSVTMFCIAGTGVLPAVAIHTLAPNRVRAVLISCSFAALSLIGMGIGPTLVAWLSESVFGGAGSLAPAMTLTALLVAPVAMTLLILSRGPYQRLAQAQAEDLAAPVSPALAH